MKIQYWGARGLGLNGGWNSLVTGKHVEFGPDITGFVTSREQGQEVVDLFGGNAKLDFRPSEPEWIQVKVIVEEEHKAVLERLYRGVVILGGILTDKTLKWALNPEESPGYEPLALRLLRERDEALRDLRSTLTKHMGALGVA